MSTNSQHSKPEVAFRDQGDLNIPPRPLMSVPLILMIVVLCGLLLGVYSLGRFAPSSPAVGKPAPTIAVLPLLGDAAPIDVAKTTKAPVMLLHFWGTWCGPCRQEYPELVAMIEEVQAAGSSGFQFVSVSCEPPVGSNSFESLRASTAEYYREIGVEVPTYCDPRGESRAAAAGALERPAMFYPTTILVDGDRNIARVWEGYTRNGVEEMRAAIESLGG